MAGAPGRRRGAPGRLLAAVGRFVREVVLGREGRPGVEPHDPRATHEGQRATQQGGAQGGPY